METQNTQQKKIRGLKNFRNFLIFLFLTSLILEYYTDGTITYSGRNLLIIVIIIGMSLTIRRQKKQMRPLIKPKYRILALIISYLITITVFSPLVFKDMQFSQWVIFPVVLLVFLIFSYKKTISQEKEIEIKNEIEELK